jgi:hypothetical protein
MLEWEDGKSLLLLDHASGISNVFVKGADLPARTNNSKAASSAEESELPLMIIGLTCSLSSPNNSDAILFSWLRIQFEFPEIVLISPLCAKALNGCASAQLGKVFVEYR